MIKDGFLSYARGGHRGGWAGWPHIDWLNPCEIHPLCSPRNYSAGPLDGEHSCGDNSHLIAAYGAVLREADIPSSQKPVLHLYTGLRAHTHTQARTHARTHARNAAHTHTHTHPRTIIFLYGTDEGGLGGGV